jgi:hypothetical protein
MVSPSCLDLGRKQVKLYQFAIMYNPNTESVKAGKKPEVIHEARLLCASDERSALLQAARKIPNDYADKLDEVEVAVRPF